MCTDLNADVYAGQLFQAANEIYKLIKNGHKVYLHDVAGLSRAPTLFLCYQALFLKFDQTPDEMFRELKKPYKNASPNIDMVQRVINDNKNFWE